jgi:NTP pyrophosphatase (non-canonical NTP hydrolase)
MNDFDRYKALADSTAIYPHRGNNLTYPTLGLVGESGEIAEKVKKIIRDNRGLLTDDARVQIAKELGDVLWYLSQIAHEIGVPLSMVAELNVLKLRHRLLRNRVHGNGDNR